MPAPGAQYHSETIQNPSEERTISPFTAAEIVVLQHRLTKQLGPEFISHRSGAGGSRVAYLEGTKAIGLANDVFGFNGWSSSLQQVQVDYVDETQNGRVNIGLSIIVRVTLRDGTYHEDIGYGSIENCKGKGAAFEKAKKEAATDGLKRALRSFGNVLGNCLYDKEYLKKVGSMKVKAPKFDESRLHRHPDYAPPPPVKEGMEMVKKEEHRTPMKPNPSAEDESQSSLMTGELEVEDEFGGNLFDGVEISEHDGTEFTFETRSMGNKTPVNVPGVSNMSGPPAGPTQRAAGNARNGPAQPTMGRVQSMPSMRAPSGGNQNPQQQQQQNHGPQKSMPPPNNRGSQTPNAPQSMARPDAQKTRGPNPTVDIHAAPKPAGQPQQQQQPLRPTPPQTHQSNQAPQNQTAAPKPVGPGQQPPVPPTVGFVRARPNLNPKSAASLNSLPAFNPHAESPVPQEKRTPGIDRTRSMKITRDSIGKPPPAPHLQQQQQPPQPQAQGFRPVALNGRNSNYVHPNQDPNRRIGAPGAHAMSPLANRTSYKPPGQVNGIKRPPLADVSNQTGNSDGHEDKKPKLDKGVENAGPVAGNSAVPSS